MRARAEIIKNGIVDNIGKTAYLVRSLTVLYVYTEMQPKARVKKIFCWRKENKTTPDSICEYAYGLFPISNAKTSKLLPGIEKLAALPVTVIGNLEELWELPLLSAYLTKTYIVLGLRYLSRIL